MPFLAAIPAALAAGGAASTIGAVGSAVGGIVGAVGGAQKDKAQGSQVSQVFADPAGAQEIQAQQASQAGLGGFQAGVEAGPGISDIQSSVGASRDLASQLQAMSKTGGVPGAADIQGQQGLAGQLFGGRRTAITNNFADQQAQYAQQAALQGRNPLDPVFRNKLAQEQTRQLGQLDAEQNAFATQQAMNQPFQRLALSQQRQQLLGGLATQALSNRQALASLGSQLQSQQQNYRLQTATRTGQGQSQSGGGLQGAISGGLAGIGAGASAGAALGSLFGGGGQVQAPSTQDLVNRNSSSNYPGQLS